MHTDLVPFGDMVPDFSGEAQNRMFCTRQRRIAEHP
jgi:hypothetical protein